MAQLVVTKVVRINNDGTPFQEPNMVAAEVHEESIVDGFFCSVEGTISDNGKTSTFKTRLFMEWGDRGVEGYDSELSDPSLRDAFSDESGELILQVECSEEHTRHYNAWLAFHNPSYLERIQAA